VAVVQEFDRPILIVDELVDVRRQQDQVADVMDLVTAIDGKRSTEALLPLIC